jgi:hypothetical protein
MLQFHSQMKATIFVLCLLLAGCDGATHNIPQSKAVAFQPQALKPSPYLPVGRSVPWGFDLPPLGLGTDFPGKGYVNGGMFGYRSDQLLPLLPDVLSGKKVCHGLEGNPDYPLTCVQLTQPPAKIVLFAGWNDMIQSTPAETIVFNLRTIVDQAHAQGAEVLL